LRARVIHGDAIDNEPALREQSLNRPRIEVLDVRLNAGAQPQVARGWSPPKTSSNHVADHGQRPHGVSVVRHGEDDASALAHQPATELERFAGVGEMLEDMPQAYHVERSGWCRQFDETLAKHNVVLLAGFGDRGGRHLRPPHRPSTVAGYRKKRPDPSSDIEKSTRPVGTKDSIETTAPHRLPRAGDLDPVVIRGWQRIAARDLPLGWAGFDVPVAAVPASDD
jgi:hypothetical protein